MGLPVVLIVEDEPLLMMHAVDIVSDAGFEPLEATNADEAVAILESRDDIRVLITDVQMSGSMDGIRLANAVRDRWPPILIIVVSGHHALAEGELPDDVTFLAKPYSEHAMLKALAKAS